MDFSRQFTIMVIVYRKCRKLQILHMDARFRIDKHFPENPAKPPEILILNPASRRKAENAQSKFILAFRQIRRQIKISRCKAVLTVAHIMSIQINRQGRFRTLEGNKGILPVLRQGKIFDIGTNRILAPGHLPRLHCLMPIPGISLIRVLGAAIAFQLPMGWHMDSLPATAVIIRCFKPQGTLAEIFGIAEMPQSV